MLLQLCCGGSPVDSTLVLVPEQGEALPEALPEILEQRPVNCLCAQVQIQRGGHKKINTDVM